MRNTKNSIFLVIVLYIFSYHFCKVKLNSDLGIDITVLVLYYVSVIHWLARNYKSISKLDALIWIDSLVAQLPARVTIDPGS